MEEVQIQYILKLIEPVLQGSASSFAVTSSACNAYNAKIQRTLSSKSSVLTQCVSWYRAGGTGKITSLFPGPVTQFWWWMRKPVWADFEIVGGDKWQRDRRMKKTRETIGIIASVVMAVGISRNWEALEYTAKEIFEILQKEMRNTLNATDRNVFTKFLSQSISDVTRILQEAIISWR